MKIHYKLTVITFCILYVNNLLFAGQNNNLDSVQIWLKKDIPFNYKIDIIIDGKLNQDTLNDFVLIARHPEIPDSIVLLVFFQESSGTFVKSLESNNLVSRYDNNMWITDDKVLHINTFEPWNGVVSNTDGIKFINDNWFYVEHSSNPFNTESSWSNSVNFITGQYKIRQEVYDKDKKPHVKEISGMIDKVGPIPLNKDCSDYMKTTYKGETIYIYDRCDLWTDKEIEELYK